MKLSRPLVLRLGLLTCLGIVALVLFLRTLPRIERFRATEEVCAAADRGDWRAALAQSDGLVADDPAGRRAAQCRCQALLATDQRAACVDLLERLLSEDAGDSWLPDPALTALVVAARDQAGEPIPAADLARRGALEYPENLLLAVQELTLRSRIEDEAEVLVEVARRLGNRRGFQTFQLRIELARRHAARAEWQAALDVMGDDPSRFPDALREAWFETYADLVAGLGRPDDLARVFEDWQRLGGDPLELAARHALTRSSHQIEDAEGTTLEMLRAAAARSGELEDQELATAVSTRLIKTLALAGRHEEALALYDETVAERGELEFVTREDLLRSATQKALGDEGLAAARGTVRFRLSEARPEDRLLVSPDVDRPIDAPYAAHEVAPGTPIELTRSLGTWPVRWVLRDRRGRAAGSGAVWVRPGDTVDVEIERRPSSTETVSRASAFGRPADGERRLFQVILDCADWRLVRYGLARGELPFFGHAIADGQRAILDSHPPFTALAVSRLVYPRKRGVSSFPELVHHLGREIEGLNFVGRNPFAALDAVLPETTDLFRTFARAGLRTVNLLHSYGTLQVGGNARIVGPGDASRALEGYRPSRPLTEPERVLLEVESPILLGHLEDMAADFDVVERLAGSGEAEIVVIRVAALDLLTHGSFQEMLSSGQDDGTDILYRAYRYIDRRLTELAARLDGDDTLIVMSDHGIRTPMEHDRRAVFLALGAGVEPGRIDETPPIQHVSGWVAELLGVKVDWPGYGTQDWIVPPRSSEERAEAPAGGRPR